MVETASAQRLSWSKRAALILFGLALALSVVEIAGRALHLMPVQPPETYVALRQVLGLMPAPYTYFFYSQPGAEFRTWVQFNYRSLRDIEHDYAVPPGTQRIMFLGDSFTAAWQVPLDQTFVSRLRASLNTLPDRPTDYDLINAGFHGWGTDQQYLYFREEGYRYRSDLVVLQIYAGNDVTDNGIAVLGLPIDPYRPYFLLDDSGRLVEVPYSGVLPQPFTGEGLGPLGWVRWFLNEHSFSYRLLRDLLTGRIEVFGSDVAGGQYVPELAEVLPVDYELFAPEYDQRWETAWAITRQLVLALREEVEASGGQMAVVLVHAVWEDLPEAWNRVVTHYNLGPGWDPARPARLFQSFLEEENIPYLDIQPARLAYIEQTGRMLNFPIDGHWNAEGHCVAAVVIQNWLITEGLIVGPPNYNPQDPITVCAP